MILQSKPTFPFCSIQNLRNQTLIMALRNDYDDLMADIEWEESEIDSGYFNEDDQAGTPMDS